MLSAYDSNNGAVLAREAHRDDGPYHCPQCEEELILKQGRVTIAHFAHFPRSDCTYASEPESAEHLSAKLEVYEALKAQPGVSKLEVERSLKEVRPDISFCFENRSIAIEVQISPLRFDELLRRTTIYAQKNIYVLWTPILPMDVFSGRYAPKEWERAIHELYEGVVYYWLSGLNVVPIEFEEYLLSPNWYSSQEKPSKRFITPSLDAATSLLNLSPLNQPRRSPYPPARLWGQPFEDSESE